MTTIHQKYRMRVLLQRLIYASNLELRKQILEEIVSNDTTNRLAKLYK